MVGLYRRLGRIAVALAAVAMLGALVPSALAAAAGPRVVIIVGPAGAAITARYRQAADAAAAVARTMTADVVRVYSPNATWPAVRAAVTGASVVVYLGHGNGWPSPYSDVLQPRTQDGFGLNPVAGVDDVAHQYFGEAFVSKLRLAPGGVVLLSHLCYASGASEPGMAEGTFDQVLGRVDNFATGFLAAGASTVVAEGHADPAALIAAAISGPASVSRAFTGAAWGHGNYATYASTRTAGGVITLDPDTKGAGYYRSLVQGAGAATRTPQVIQPVAPIPAGPPSLASAGARFGSASVVGSTAPGTPVSLRLPVTKAAARLPKSLLVGVRWLPLVPSAPSDTAATTADGLVVGEADSDVVETASATVSGTTLKLSVPSPKDPGTYVVLMTLATADGTPYDVATQALLRPFTVVVPKPIDLRISAPATVEAQASSPVAMRVDLANTGTSAWGSELYADMWDDPSLDPWLDRYFSSVLALTATWLDPVTGAATPAASYPLPRGLGAPGHEVSVDLAVRAPDQPGHYLLMLSLAARGNLGSFPQSPLLVPVLVR